MSDLPIGARLYVVLVLLAGGATLVGYAPHSVPHFALFGALLILSSLAAAFKVSLPLGRSGTTMSISYVVDVVSLVLVGADLTMFVAAASAWAQSSLGNHDRSWPYRTAFSVAALVLSVKAAGIVYTWAGGPAPEEAFSAWMLLMPLLGVAVTYFLCNTMLVAAAVGLSTQHSITKVWNEQYMSAAPSYFVGALVAAPAAAVIYYGGYWTATLAALPLYLSYRGYRRYLGRVREERQNAQQASELHLATIEALAVAIDAKDQTAQGHIRRVQIYAASLARALGMSDSEIQGVKTAALLHDIGKLAIPEQILSKPGPLTQEEFQKIRIHPQVGAEIISGVPFPYPVAPLVLSHHERWDGRGYPDGLKGEDIPLGARVLTVVDYFDALTSERPYHKAMSFEAATGLLLQEAGKALDPRIVSTFIELYPKLAVEAAAVEEPPRRPMVANVPAVGLGGPTGETAQGNVFRDIALAHREIYALYEIAQAMGSSLGIADTMALIASKLSPIVPFSCCALFLYNDDTEALKCRFATGVEADTIQQLTIRSGHGLNGWVARNRSPLVNGRPGADFDAGGFPSRRTTLQAALICPLAFNERFIGTIAVYHTEPSIYTDDHRRLLDRISEQAAAVIYNSMVFEQTQEDSLTDPLTGLPNTRFMLMHLTRELARAERLKSEVSLLVMDLDNFKDINDTHGHHVGDRALREVAGVLRAGIRPYDICIRYAGDEFIIVLSGCGAEEAERKRLELQRSVDTFDFEPRPGQHLALRASIGAAVFPHDGRSYETLLATADGRMYRDKTRRKEAGDGPSGGGVHQELVPTIVSEADLDRAAAGVL